MNYYDSPRVTTKKLKGGFRTKVKCRCCKETLEIFYGSDKKKDPYVEINGVVSTVATWKKILKEVFK